jgi:hypothetical protein
MLSDTARCLLQHGWYGNLSVCRSRLRRRLHRVWKHDRIDRQHRLHLPFGSIFAWGYTPMQPIYPAEVVSNKIRAKAIGTFELTAGAAGFLNTFVGPIALSSVKKALEPHVLSTTNLFSRLGTGSICSSCFGIRLR